MQWLYSPIAPPGTPSVSAEPSILAEHLYFPFYDYIVKFFPKWWIPNKVTIAGILSTVAASLLMLSSMPPGSKFQPGRAVVLPASLVVEDPSVPCVPPLDPTQMQPVFSFLTPASLLTLCGLLNLLYCVADNTDGRLARRDRKTSVIGEYLDHGLDCVTSLLSTSCAFALLSSLTNMTTSVCLIAFVTVLSHTLHYEANIFIWGNRIATVDEAMIFFGVGMWIPLVFPSVGTAVVPVEYLTAIFGAGSHWVAYLRPLRLIDLVYIFYSLAQAQTIASVAARRLRMLCRIHVIFSVLNSVVFLALMGEHTTFLESLPETQTSVFGYTLGPFTYPAVWAIAYACTASTIIHIPIMAKCARLPQPDPLPLVGVMLVWCLFVSYPVAGVIAAAVVHVGQLLINVQLIEYNASLAKDSEAQSSLKAASRK
ncbi:putative ethanolamine phosphotransferase [Leptomonas pyrrhocoris]|uniref:Putative ethanolamine phosphotransferase n=1 Tax=Leptomonas pyrrhocoris TaxID=157538 RepID=A0A0N0DU85_LEPPY|nr:putative ethanolamine phosphotransferase [Leptomonas pyrrhocoris]KPA78562.1 putative ethanolamine phosphotransferase [Leptomonas pyrrhocoris]|eukprot:XP_015657001.1 putative ethanolamine phosphotransferase [Leptomonas pyrrhocoris]